MFTLWQVLRLHQGWYSPGKHQHGQHPGQCLLLLVPTVKYFNYHPWSHQGTKQTKNPCPYAGGTTCVKWVSDLYSNVVNDKGCGENKGCRCAVGGGGQVCAGVGPLRPREAGGTGEGIKEQAHWTSGQQCFRQKAWSIWASPAGLWPWRWVRWGPLEAVDRAAMWPDPCFTRLALAAGPTVLLGRGRVGSRRQSQEAMVGQQYILSHYPRKKWPCWFPQSDILTLRESLLIKETCHGEKILKRNAGKCSLQPGSLL